MSFFYYIGDDLTQQATGLADTVSASLASLIVPVFVSATAVMVLFHGLAVIRGDLQQPFMSLLWKIFKIGVIIAVIDLYQQFGIVDLVLSVQNGLTQAISGAPDPYQAVDNAIVPLIGFFSGLLLLGGSLFTEAGTTWNNIVMAGLVFSFIVLGGGVLALAFFYALLATLGMMIVLGLGPLFIAGLAFGPTAKYFESWLSSVFQFSLVGAVSSVVLSIAISAQLKMIAYAFPNIIVAIVIALIMGLVFLLFMIEVPRMVSALTSGADVAGGVAGFATFRGLYSAPWVGRGASASSSSAKAAIAQSAARPPA